MTSEEGPRTRASARVCLMLSLIAVAIPAGAGDVRLVDAVKSGDSQSVRALLAQGVDVNARQGDGATALHWAAHQDDRATADLLIKAGAQVNAANDLGVTPLWVAGTNGSAAMVATLVKAGADPNIAPPTGVTALMQAARTGNVEAVTLLLAHRANVDAAERSGEQTALMWAVTQRHPRVVQALIDGGANVHATSNVWRQRVLMCCERFLGDPEGITDVDRGAFTALLFAARLGELESARALVKGKANVNDTAVDGTSALALAILSGHATLASFLLEQGADPNANRGGHTALHAAVLRGDLQLVQSLLQRGANPNVQLTRPTPTRRNEKSFAPDWAFDRAWIGGTPFWLAARFGEADIMRALAAKGADTRMAAADGLPPLIVAAQAENVPSRRGMMKADRERRAVQALTAAIELGADVNGATGDGNTALHIAASKRINSIVEFLAGRGAALHARNHKGQTPLALAMAEPEAPKGIAVIYNRVVNDGSTAELLRKLGATE